VKIFGLIDLCMGAQDLLALGCRKARGDDLKRLVAIETRV